MTVIARALDDLDRLAFRLSRTVRTQYPQLLTQGFTLTDLEERLLPYRDVRREMADAGADAFETTLLRLVSGERGYLLAEPELQAACRQALGFPSPSLSMVRTWSSSALQLARSASGTPTSTTTIGTSDSGSAAAAGLDVFPQPRGQSTSAPPANPVTNTPARATAPANGTAMAPAHTSCRFCSSRLPDSRRVTFCPHCGLDLTKRQCAACSTELDAHWRFCVTCGRRDG